MHLPPRSQTVGRGNVPFKCFTAVVSFADVVNRKKVVKFVVCQTDLTWVSSDIPVQTVHSVVQVSGGLGTVSTGTQASSGKSGPASADAQALWESALKADKSSGSPGAGPSASPKHQTLTPGLGQGPVLSPESRPMAPGRGPLLPGARPSPER